MNKTIETQTRKYLKELLEQCTEGQQLMFKRMYSHKDLEKDINQVVDDMPESKLDHAVTQCERSVEKNNSDL